MNHSAECKVNASIVLDGFIQAKRWNDCCLFNYRAKHIFCIALIASSSLLQRFVFLMLCVSQLHRPHLCILPVSRPDWTYLTASPSWLHTHFSKKTFRGSCRNTLEVCRYVMHGRFYFFPSTRGESWNRLEPFIQPKSESQQLHFSTRLLCISIIVFKWL